MDVEFSCKSDWLLMEEHLTRVRVLIAGASSTLNHGDSNH